MSGSSFAAQAVAHKHREVSPPPRLFKSFWLGGFEAACHLNRAGVRLDMLASTQHDVQAAHDYVLLRSVGISAARDAARWRLIDRPGGFDFSSLAPMARAAQASGVQVIWTLCHYGWPDDLDLMSAAFVERFARYAGAVAAFLADGSDDIPFFCPMNEISFLAWAAGQKGSIHPFLRRRGGEVKRQLVRATIAACDAIWSVDPRARIVQVEPTFHVVPPRGTPYSKGALAQRASQWEASDMLAGHTDPELGGDPKYLDVIGVNYYHGNQWEYPARELGWAKTPRDDRWLPLHCLLAETHERYRRPMFIAETSHFGVGRAHWLREIADEVLLARAKGTPIDGVCLFPIIDRHDWTNSRHWHNSGLWDLVRDREGLLRRVINPEYAAELDRVQQLLPENGRIQRNAAMSAATIIARQPRM